MANQWALLIGINQYKALQPLMYAQTDAVALRNFFVDELGIPVNNCTLVTDLSASIEPHAYAPLRKEIESQLQTLCRDKVQPGDLLWVFFSGCGLTEGGQDYWMTVDSDPMKPSETAISLTSIFNILNQAKTDQILLAMDMNRSQGAIGHRDMGAQTLTLANDFNITTLLSCQPDEFSHETMYVRHGLFTKALLEGLRYHGCITTSQLGSYLSDRVPELCTHHCRPPQHPAITIPAAQKFMMVVPSDGLANLSVTEGAAVNLSSDVSTPTTEFSDSPEVAAVPPSSWNPSLTNQPAAAVAPSGTKTSFDTHDLAVEQGEVRVDPSTASRKPSVAAANEPKQGAIVLKERDNPEDESEDIAALGGLWKWGALAAAIAFLVGVFFRYQPALFRGDRAADADRPTVTAAGDSVANDSEAAADAGETSPEGEEVPPTGESLFPAEIDPIEAGETALQRAEEAIATSRYGEARAWLTQVPPELQDSTYQSLLQQANSEVAEAAVRNQSVLESARQIIQPASASMFNDAIEQARQVPPEDPYYEQAQADIARWSQVILDLAEGRAASGNINGAIAAARLVPDDQPAIADLAQQRIGTWEQQIANQDLIQQAQNSLQPGQASSFNDAVRTLEQITPDQPGYETAQARINQWSEDILAIARARAAQGDLGGAIAAARLVPDNQAAYAEAQQEIQRWQEQL
ncbi:caspase family protein [Oscillatoria sp. CS-180]|uniref:caspase family protein n=1 Tax=Oscillatoria sp. CS-180 TaxID=3021720 RepID=UPI00232C9664|nr:caspase family protein [Oscillatoria sp. CS-180]MDB9529102.1 caspase family protein [Oscillatoria sp. CS-180]